MASMLPRSRRTRVAVAGVLWLLATVPPTADALAGGDYLDGPVAVLVLLVAGYVLGAWMRPLLAGIGSALGAAVLAAANQLVSPATYTYANDLFFYALLFGGIAVVGALFSGRAAQVRTLRELTAEQRRLRADAVAAASLEEQNRLAWEVSERLAERIGGVLVQSRGARVEPDEESRAAALRRVETAAREALDQLRETLGGLHTPPPPESDVEPVESTPPGATRPAPLDYLLGLSGPAVAGELLLGDDVAFLAAFALGVALGVAVAWRRAHPVLAVALTMLVMLVAALSGIPVQDPVTALLPLSLLSYAVGAHPRRIRDRWIGCGLLVAGVALIGLVRTGGAEPGDGLVPTLGLVGFAILTGVLAGQHEQRATRERRLLTEVRAGRGHAVRLAVARRRQATARDLHDTVAHAMTVVCLQAEVAQRPPADPVAALEVIERTARSALAELRTGLAEPSDVPPGSTPSLATVAESVRQLAEELGASVAVRLLASPETPCPQAALVVRVLRESLVNLSRHAPGEAAVVELGGQPLRLLVTNRVVDGRRFPAGSGSGLSGLAETVNAAGGRLEHGRLGESFRLEVLLPSPAGLAP